MHGWLAFALALAWDVGVLAALEWWFERGYRRDRRVLLLDDVTRLAVSA